MHFKFSIQALNELSIQIDFGNKISVEINQFVFQLFQYFSHNPFSGFQEAIPTYAALTIIYNPLQTPYNLIELKQFVTKTIENFSTKAILPSTSHEIPVVYNGEDLEYIAHNHNLSIQEVVALHSSVNYRVYMLGFLPGFLYLGGLAEQLHTPRRDTPRPLVEAGSVGIGGNQTGVYPVDSPGGWHIIGRTNFEFFNASKTPPSPFKIGDQVRFVPVKRCLQKNQTKQQREALNGVPDLVFIKSGVLSTIQDIGRYDYQHLGVNPNGVMDYKAMRLLNILLMNAPNEAVIEMHFPAAEIQMNTPCTIALGGADFGAELNDSPISNWCSIKMAQGDRLKFKQKINGQRLYLAVAGGFKIKTVMNSCSTNILANFGGKILKKIDSLNLKKRVVLKT